MKISKTGFWSGDNAHLHHVKCEPLAVWLLEYLKDQKENKIYDFGCGLGYYLDFLSNRGFSNCTGFEGDIPVNKIFQNIVKQDLTVPFSIKERGTCIFFEVAEHIPSEHEEILLKNVVGACNDKIIMSWAVRGQSGLGHVNCLNNDEVIDRMKNLGFSYLKEDSISARSVDLSSAPWFKNTIMIFKKIK